MRKKKRDIQREQEILNKPIRSDGVGEDPVIQTLVSDEYVTMGDADMVDFNLALQQLIRGQAAMLENMNSQSEEVAKLRERFNKYEEDAKRWETDRDKWLEEKRNEAEKLKVTGEALDKIKAKAAQTHKEAHAAAQATESARRIRVEAKLAKEPKVKVRDLGIPITVRQGKSVKMMLEAETVNYCHKRYTFPPGQEVEVPMSVFQAYEKKKKLREMVSDRKQSMQIGEDGTMTKEHEQHKRVQSFAEVNEKYKTDTMPFQVR